MRELENWLDAANFLHPWRKKELPGENVLPAHRQTVSIVG